MLSGYRPSYSIVFEREPLLHMDDDADVDHFNKTHNSANARNNNNIGSNSLSDLAEVPPLRYNSYPENSGWKNTPYTDIKCNPLFFFYFQ